MIASRAAVAGVLDVLDTSALAMSGGLLATICFSVRGADADLLGKADEVVEECLSRGTRLKRAMSPR